MKVTKPILIGIAGGTASGKTSITEIICEDFKLTNSVKVIREDDYYKDQSDIDFEERKKTNYDHPFAFDYKLLYEQLDELIKGNPINKPIYDYTVHNRSKNIEVIRPADVIIIEGLFVLEEKELRNRLDIKIFVDTPADVRLARRVKRDINERKRELDNVLSQYLNTVRLMHEEFIEPSKKFANLIIPEEDKNEVALDLLITKIDSIIK